MLSGVPKLTYTFGYTNASWTLKADLSARWACRLLHHLDHHGLTQAVAPRDAAVPAQPFIDFSSGYVQRGAAALPLQGAHGPWRVHQN
jgi:monooxygenase